MRVTRSLDQNRALIKKVYFPRLIAPISSVAPALTEFGVLFTLLVLTCVYYFVKDGVFYLRLGPQILVAFCGGGDGGVPVHLRRVVDDGDAGPSQGRAVLDPLFHAALVLRDAGDLSAVEAADAPARRSCTSSRI